VRKAVAFSVTLTILLVTSVLIAFPAEAPVGPAAAISAPAHAAVITGDTATVTVLFDAGTGSKVTAAELYVDGELHDTVAVSPPVSSGTCKLTWRCADFDKGKHTLTARVYDSTGHSRAVDVEVMLESAAGAGKAQQLRVEIMAPAEGQEISGTTQVRVAADESHVRYVMLLIDDVFVALTNMPPFTYALNTTRYLNGPHALRATAFDLSDVPTDSPTIHVVINNPGGRTEMHEQPGAETGSPAPSPAATAPATPPAPVTQSVTPPPAQTISEAPGVKSSAPAAATAPSAPPGQPIATAADASAPDTAAAGLDAAMGQSGNPSAPSIAVPRGIVAAPAKAAAAPRLAPAIAKASTASAARPLAAKPVASAPAAPRPMADARLTAATASSAPATSDEPTSAPSSPAAADQRDSIPAQATRIAMAPPAPASVEKPVEPAVATAAHEVEAATVSDDAAEATSKVAAASVISRLPKIAALPAASRTPVMVAPATALAADAAPTSAPGGIQVAALAPGMAQGNRIAPAITRAPKPAAPVQIARAPAVPAAVSATVAEQGEVIVHTVAPGEQLGSISAKYEIPAAVIARFNGFTSQAKLAAGRTLRIPWKSALVLNGEPVYTDVPLTNEGSITLAPFRAIVEHSGGAVHWIPAKQQVRALAFSHDIRVTMGSRAALVDAREYMLETEAKLVRERAMVPLGLFRDALGFKVSFEPGTGRIYLAAQ
jgi:LysM repeat protein